jgi:serine/threonine protein kinase/tetratricopeptide (TPR) repeat protein
MSPPPDPSRDLLFGLLALQVGLVDQGQLVAAFQAWTRDKARPLAGHLVSRGDLDAEQRGGVEAMVALHLKKHGDVERSLAAVPAGTATRERLASLADPDLDASLSYARPGPGPTDGDADRTRTYRVGTATSDGRRFLVLRPHARGGLGAVFVALDSELNREVALKQILDDHADDPVSRQRFLVEAEITGGLEHPGIVPVYGLGTYGDGRPYYAMRFIRGDSLKEAITRFHADESLRRDPGRRSLELRKLLRRFTDVCNAIEYAHSRGVLHRDIKPGNVIVGKHGETLVVDWGLAKTLGRAEVGAGDERQLTPSLASGSAETLPGATLGTPAYMSPEQARGDPEALGPRSDVYSLGATLSCLLTGKPPFEGEVGTVLRQVQRGEFPPPRRLDPSIDEALEAVCLKAVALRPEDRYASCRELAEDVERWAADEPVTAYREPLGRRARRWAKRNRTLVSSAAVALVAGVVGLSAVAVVQSRSNAALTKADGDTRAALAQTREASKETLAALGQSEESRKQAEAVGMFLVDAFTKPDPSVDGKDVKLADLLNQAMDGLSKGFTGSKATEGALLEALGNSYAGLGLHPKAEEAHRMARAVREAALGPSHRDTLRSATLLAAALWDLGRRGDGVALHEATLARKVSALGPEDLDSLQTRAHLANALMYSGRAGASEAIPLHLKILAIRESKLGPDHLDTLTSRNNLANAYYLAGRYAEAIPIYEATLKQRESKLGPDHPHTLESRNNLALAYWRAGRTAEAFALHEAVLKQCESILGPDHPHTLTSRDNLANAYRAAGRDAEAISIYEVALEQLESKLGPDHHSTLTSRGRLALAYESINHWADAEPFYRENLSHRRKEKKPDSTELVGDVASLGRNLLKQSKWAEAEPLLRECLAIREKTQPDVWSTFNTKSLLGGARLGQEDYAEAGPLLLAGYEGMKRREAAIPEQAKDRLPEALDRLIEFYTATNKPDEVARWRAERANYPENVVPSGEKK